MQCHSDGSINFVVHFIFFSSFASIPSCTSETRIARVTSVYLTSEYIHASLLAKTGAL